ncbi:MAG TPA: carboxypeptidase regulatory-like domain-containing protein, partial [Ilumatobacter sp.]|nr:carboxypeptidase regulatory-like domain-containing protein [Ilumatobacter sp.]
MGGALAAALSWTSQAVAVCPGECSVPGRGSMATECIVEFDGVTLNYPPGNEKRVQCTDGDVACDADGAANGICEFNLRVCLNNTDPRYPACTPSDVASFVLKNKPTTSPKFDPQLAALQAAVDAIGLPTSASVCTNLQTVTVPLRVKGGNFVRGKKKVKHVTLTSTNVKDVDSLKLFCEPSPVFPTPISIYARAKQITSPNETIGGPLGRSQVGDYLLVNDKIKVAILRPGRHAYNAVGSFGGNIVDGDRHHADGVDRDSFEILAPGINIENTANYTSVTVLNDGTNGMPAVIRATGVDDLLDKINPSSVVAGFGFPFPAAYDDTDLPITIQTDYTLAAGSSYVEIETTVTNTSAGAVNTFLGEYLNGSGEIELFQRVYGFGEALITDPCPASQNVSCSSGTCNLCNFTAYSGENTAKGVSYGYIHAQNATSAFTTDGVHVPLFGRTVGLTLVGLQTGNYNLAPAGDPGDAVTVTRYFAIGDGSVASIESVRNLIQHITTGTLAGTVTAGGLPVEDADVAVLGTPYASGPTSNVVTHFRTDANGAYSGTLPPGSYTVMANKDGRLAAAPASAPVTVNASATTNQNFTLPEPGRIRVLVTDENGDPISAKVQLVGFDPTPDPGNSDTVLIISVSTGVFGDYSSNKDGLPFGIAHVSFAGRDGDTGEHEVEPGSYQVAVSHGPRYSAFTQNVTVTAGALTTVNAQIAQVVSTPGYISGDWHVHSINSADCEVTNEERVMTQIAEGMDFFTPSDHEMRIDFAQTIADLGVSDLISTATSAEITTFDYGHFNSWPVSIDGSLLNGGSVDHGGAAPAGQDFPSFGNFSLSPAQIYAAAHADPLDNLIQINHMASHFATGQSGLGIDTAMVPPQSSVSPATRRLAPAANLFDDGF